MKAKGCLTHPWPHCHPGRVRVHPRLTPPIPDPESTVTSCICIPLKLWAPENHGLACSPLRPSLGNSPLRPSLGKHLASLNLPSATPPFDLCILAPGLFSAIGHLHVPHAQSEVLFL